MTRRRENVQSGRYQNGYVEGDTELEGHNMEGGGLVSHMKDWAASPEW